MHVGKSFDLLPLLAFPLFENLGPRPIEFSPYFLLFFPLTKPFSWILLIERFPMTVTILKSEFWIKSYGFPKFQVFLHLSSTSLPRGTLSLVTYRRGLLMWHPPHVLFVVGSSIVQVFSLLTQSPDDDLFIIEFPLPYHLDAHTTSPNDDTSPLIQQRPSRVEDQ
jgi:hypothetical protein